MQMNLRTRLSLGSPQRSIDSRRMAFVGAAAPGRIAGLVRLTAPSRRFRAAKSVGRAERLGPGLLDRPVLVFPKAQVDGEAQVAADAGDHLADGAIDEIE